MVLHRRGTATLKTLRMLRICSVCIALIAPRTQARGTSGHLLHDITRAEQKCNYRLEWLLQIYLQHLGGIRHIACKGSL